MKETSNNSFNRVRDGEDIAPHSESTSSQTSESIPNMEDLVEESLSVESIVELAPDVVCEPEPEDICEPEPEVADPGDPRPMSSVSKKKKKAKKLVGFE